MCLHYPGRPEEGIKFLGAGIEPGSSARAAGALNCPSISPTHPLIKKYIYSQIDLSQNAVQFESCNRLAFQIVFHHLTDMAYLFCLYNSPLSGQTAVYLSKASFF